MMRRLAAATLILSAVSASSYGDEFANNLPANQNVPALEALAQDLGALAGAGSFHHGKALGFPLGVDLGVHAASVRISEDNVVLRDDDSSARTLWTQFELGLPAHFNVIARYGSVYGAEMMGGGARWGVFTPGTPGLPAVSLSALYTVFDHGSFDAETVSGNAVVSFDVPFIHPFLGFGYDRTSVEAGGVKADKDGTRLEAGINVSVIPFTYVTVGGGWANGGTMGHLGAGIRF